MEAVALDGPSLQVTLQGTSAESVSVFFAYLLIIGPMLDSQGGGGVMQPSRNPRLNGTFV